MTRYELGNYRYPRDPSGRSETAVYRRTRVAPAIAAKRGVASETFGMPEFVPASFAPLPPSAELAAELVAQKAITNELRAIKAAMIEMEQKARAQYGALVQRTEEALKAREQLEAQVARGREIEAQLRERLQTPPTPPPPAPAAAATTGTDVKW